MEILLVFGIFFGLILIGAPLFSCLFWAAIVPLVMFNPGTPLTVIPQKLFTTVNSFSTLAIPFFVIAGGLMDKGGISKRLINFAMSLVGWMPGSLAVCTFLASAFFGAVSGSAVATVAAIGGIMVPRMLDDGYPLPFALGTAAAGGYLGIIIPPSIPMVLYSMTVGVSVADMFTCGFIPGILLTGAMSVYAVFWGTKHPEVTRYEFKMSEVGKSFVNALWALFMPVIILGGIYGGIFTPTEAAAVACVYAIIVGAFVFHELSLANIGRVIRASVGSSALVIFMMAIVNCFSQVLTMENIPALVKELIVSTASTPFEFWVIVTIVLFITGMVIDLPPAVLLMGTLLAPVATSYGIDPIVFGLVMIVNLGIGLCTPPVGMNLYVAAGLKKVTTKEVLSRHLAMYLVCSTIILILLMACPKIITFLPSLFE